jgi:serine phosphatase RsbU (regulator of sigma subunit)
MMERRQAVLDVRTVGAEGPPSKRIRLASRTTLGHHQDNDILLPDGRLSDHHAEFQQRDDSFYVVDLESANGTYVNQVRVERERALSDGDIITVGAFSLVFREPEPPVEPNEPKESSESGVVMAVVEDEYSSRTTHSALEANADQNVGLFCKATNSLIAHQPLPELYDKVLATILDSIAAERAAIMFLEGKSRLLTLKATRSRCGLEPGPVRRDIVQRVLKRRDALLVPDVPEDTTSLDPPAAGADSIRSVMCAPLWVMSNKDGKRRLMGMLYVDSHRDRPPLTDHDLHILVMLANVTATRIENARSLEEMPLSRQIEEDMRQAAEIQSDLLPRSAPLIEGYCVCGTTEPCRAVGGDYFDFEYDGRVLSMALADVSGKGTGAAMLTGALRTAVRARWRDPDLTLAAARINQTFHQNVPPDRYATLFFARLDPPTGRLEYVNAGHNRPLLIRPDGQWLRLEVGGTVVGAFADMTYRQDTVLLGPGACLLVFSDGISDAWPDHDEADRQLVKLVLARRWGDIVGLREEIFRATDRTHDDRTLIILNRLVDKSLVP